MILAALGGIPKSELMALAKARWVALLERIIGYNTHADFVFPAAAGNVVRWGGKHRESVLAPQLRFS